MKTAFRLVLDTNVILATYIHPSEDSPNVELLQRWEKREFSLLMWPLSSALRMGGQPISLLTIPISSELKPIILS